MGDSYSKIEDAQRKYFQSPQGKKAVEKYLNSPQGKQAKKRYHQSSKGKAASLRYYFSEKGKTARESQKLTRQMMAACKEFLEQNPDKTTQDFLKEQRNR